MTVVGKLHNEMNAEEAFIVGKCTDFLLVECEVGRWTIHFLLPNPHHHQGKHKI